jgi:hypothetical protein
VQISNCSANSKFLVLLLGKKKLLICIYILINVRIYLKKVDTKLIFPIMSFALWFVRSPKKFNVHLGQKVSFLLACFHISAAPRLENPDSDEKDALFGLDK